ncbi:MAG TPA: hypothetical protein VFO25_04755 [Candidatus Eremiobacteraceae bacterium]|nr:hypothetical protein [Candidatus Eremiobacteraceae bacterium]
MPRFGSLFAAGVCAAIVIGCASHAVSPTQTSVSRGAMPAPVETGSPGPHQLFVADATSDAVIAFDWFANGDVTPEQNIQGPSTGLTAPQTVEVDKRGFVYVGDAGPSGPNIKVYNPDATGDATPARTITSSAMTDAPLGIAMDLARDVYVASQTDGVLVFGPGVNGVVSPSRTIAGPHTGLSDVVAVALDAANNVFALDAANQAISEFAAGANGDVTPIRTIAGPNTGLAGAVDLRVNRTDVIYVSDGHQVLVFPASRSGNAKPARTVQAIGWGTILGIQIHDSNLEMSALADADGTPGMLDMSQSAKGPVVPSRIITGPSTGLGGLDRIKIHDLGG